MAKRLDVFGVEVTGDISGLDKAMKQAVKIVQTAERSLKNVNKALELDPNNETLLNKQRDALKQNIKEYEEYIQALQNARKKLVSNKNTTDKTLISEQATHLDKEISVYKKKLEELKNTLKTLPDATRQAFEVKLDKFYESMRKSSEAIEKVKKNLSNIDKSIDLDSGNLDLYVQKQEHLRDAIRITETQLKNYEKQLKALYMDPGYLAGYDDHQKEFVELQQKIKEAEVQLEKWKKQVEESPGVARFNKQMAELSETFRTIADRTAGLSRAFQGLITSGFNAYKSMESDIANIKRVVSDLSQSTIDDLKQIAIQTGTTFHDISEYATIAGALGLAEQDISKFAKTMTDLNTATGGVFSGEEGAKGIAVFLKQLNLGIDQAENFGSAIAVIGDKYADIGDETVRVATRFTGLTSLIKTNQYELLGLAGVMADLGISADTNANGVNRAFLQIEKVIGGGVKDADKKLRQLANTAGMTSEQFKTAWGTNAIDAFLRFTDGLKSEVFNEINEAIDKSDSKIQGFADALGWSADVFKQKWAENSKGVFDEYVEALGNMSEENESASVVLQNLGISSVNTAQTLLRLSGSGNEVRKAIELTTKAWNENTALAEKSGTIYETTERRLQGMYESIKQLLASLVDSFGPTIKDMIDNVTNITKSMGNMSPTVKKLIAYFISFNAALSPVSRGLSNVLSLFVKNEDGVTKFSVAIDSLGKAFKFLGGTTTATIAGVTLLGVALARIEQEAVNNSVFSKVNEDLKNLRTSMEEVSNTANEKYLSSVRELVNGTTNYGDAIGNLLDKLNKEKLSYQERAEIQNTIKGYIDEMNATLGEEVFFFDTVSGKITSQKGDIDSVREAYQLYLFELKKQNWLDAHAEQYNQARENMQIAQNDLMTASDGFINAVSEIPPEVIQAFLQAKEQTGTVEEAIASVQTKLNESGVLYSPEWFDTLRDSYNNFMLSAGEAEQTMTNMQTIIDSYEAVESSTLENFNEIVNSIQTAAEKQEEIYHKTATETIPEIITKKELVKSVISDEDSLLQNVIDKYDSQIGKIDMLNTKAQQQFDHWANIHSKEQTIITDWDSWSPENKKATLTIETVYSSSGTLPNGMTYNIPNIGGGGSRSGGYGYGDTMERLIGAINNLPMLQSGGYRSGGIVVNNTFSISSASISNQTVKGWAYQIVDIINEELGYSI